MSAIPEDIWRVAYAASEEGDRGHGARVTYIARAILTERKRCIGHVYGLAGSDNVAQRTVEAIRAGA